MLNRLLLVTARRLFKNWVKYAGNAAKHDPMAQKFVADILRVSAYERLALIERDVIAQTEGVVSSGPFKGMVIDSQISWGDGGITPKLLGCYEQEISGWMADLGGQSLDAVINIGSAEGYYAVGAAMILDTPKVIAVDIDPVALDATRRNAERNGVAAKIECRGRMGAPELVDILDQYPCSLVICDCEGDEVELITVAVAAAGVKSHFLIECHDFIGRPVTKDVAAVLSATHDTRIVSEGPRDPNRYEILRNRDNLDRWLAMCEFRPQTMQWIIARPHISAVE
ncbi:MAG: hypothetical protein COW30_12240 [Rhodospirillales bacterium CG15_BIG_FIL_POST_REV_8_21_14_020_66_15]|nr:MAG: hypothetical protein COW30_12240 [Rhodospirillales bacterium CG15_BIG_FIL_POST_REV_8_21_14_020_66_15]